MRHTGAPPWRGLLGLLGMLLAACGGPAAPPPPGAPIAPPAGSADAGPAVITFGTFEFWRATYEPLAERFNAENPDIHVQIVSTDAMLGPPRPGESRARQLAAAADTFVTFQIAEPEAVRLGYLRDLAPFIAADAGFARDDYFPGAIRADAAGAVALLPAELHLPLLAYNRELWAARGLPPPSPGWSWADLRAAAEQLTLREGGEVSVYGLMQTTPLAILQNPALTGERDFVADLVAGRARLDDAETAAALERVAELFRAGVLFAPPEYPDGSFLHSGDFMPLIEGGRMGIWMAGDGRNPMGAPLPIEVGLAPIPASDLPYLQVQRGGFAMSGGTRHPEQAWRWLAFLSAQPTISSLEGRTVIPARRSLAEAGGHWDELGAEGRAAAEAILARLPGQAPPTGVTPAPIGDELPLFRALNDAFTAMLSEGAPAAQALREAQAELDAELAAAPPSPTPNREPLAVATARPLPTAAPAAERITFLSVAGVDQATRRAAERFNQEYPQYAVSVEPFPFPADGVVRLADLAAQSDCFGGFGPPSNDAERAQLLDLQPLLDADASFPRDDYPPALLEQFRSEGRLYGLPDRVIPRLLFYNRDLFDAAGLAYPEVTWTIDDLIGAAQTLSGGAGAGRQYGFADLSASDLLFFLGRAGVAPFRAQGGGHAPDFTSPALRAAAETYIGLLAAAAPEQRPADYERGGGDSELYRPVAEGRVAMWLGFGLNAPPSGEQTSFELGVAPIPLGAQPLGLGDLISEGLFISAGSSSPAACWAWLRFLSAEPARYAGALPARPSLAQAPELLERAPAGADGVYEAYGGAMAAGIAEDGLASQGGVERYWLLRAVDRAAQGADLAQELADAQFFAEQYQACVQGGERANLCVRQVDPSYSGWLEE